MSSKETKVPTSTAASVAPSSRGRVPPSKRSRAKSKRSASPRSRGGQETGARSRKRKPTPDESSTATRDQKTETSQSTATQPPVTGPNGYPLVSLSQLAENCELDRAIARRRLQDAGIKPVEEREKLKLYEQTPEVEKILEQSGDPRLNEIKVRDAELRMKIREVEFNTKTGRSIDFDEAADVFTRVAKGLFDRFIQYSTKAGPRLHKCKSGREVSLALRRDFEKIFGELRVDFRRFIK